MQIATIIPQIIPPNSPTKFSHNLPLDCIQIRAKKILLGLGFTPSLLSRPTSDLSGGWAMRAALGAAIFVKPNLLLLDEPTNHLDLHALVWLEHWLINEFEGMALIVSHDTYFLNSVCTDVLELRSVLAGASKSSLECYTGDYSTYQNTLAERKVAQTRAKIAYEKEKDKLREFVNRQNMGDSKSFHSQRKMKMKQLEAMVVMWTYLSLALTLNRTFVVILFFTLSYP